MSPFKVLTLLAIVFAAGYQIGDSTNEEIKEKLDNIFDNLGDKKDEIADIVVNYIDKSSELSAEEIKINLEKFMDEALTKIGELGEE